MRGVSGGVDRHSAMFCGFSAKITIVYCKNIFMISVSENFISSFQKFIELKLQRHGTFEGEIVWTEPYKILHAGLRYDVRVSNPTYTSGEKRQRIWDFDIRRQKKHQLSSAGADFYVLVGAENSIPSRVFLIPSQEAIQSHIRVSIDGVSKYQSYAI